MEDLIRILCRIPSQMHQGVLPKPRHLSYTSKEKKLCYLCSLDLLDTTVTETSHSRSPFASLSTKSCSVRLTSKAVRKDHPLLPAQLMHCHQLVDITLPLIGNAHSTRLLGCFQRTPLFIIWAAATGTLLSSYLSSLMDLVTIPDAKFCSESTPFSTQLNSSSLLLSQGGTAHHAPAVQITVTPEGKNLCALE